MPKKTVEEIVEGHNHYVLAVKGNQPKLREELEEIAKEQAPMDIHIEEERKNGYENEWFVEVFDASESKFTKDWKEMTTVVRVRKTSIRISTKQIFVSERYYISDLKKNADFFHKGIRGHWGIENGLHWTKDVFFKEDDNRIRKTSGASNASVFSSMVINLHRTLHPGEKILDSQMKFCATLKKTIRLLRI